MLSQVFAAMLITSCIGTVFGCILLSSEAVTKRYFSGGWHYYMWIAVFVTMVLPVRIDIPQYAHPAVRTVRETVRIILPEAVGVMPNEVKQIPQAEIISFEALSLIWIAVAVLIFASKVAMFVATMIRLHKNAEIQTGFDTKGFIKRKITVCRSDKISSPFISGIFKPKLFLPKAELTESQVKNILTHESVHLRRGDVLIKWFMVAVKCVHWFNPAVYFIGNKIAVFCEISCDLAATRNMSLSEKSEYINTVLSLIKTKGIQPIYATSMASAKKHLIKRFSFIKEGRKIKKPTKIISAVFSVILIFLVLTTSGIVSVRVNTEKKEKHIKPDDRIIHTEISENIPEPEDTPEPELPVAVEYEETMPVEEIAKLPPILESEPEIQHEVTQLPEVMATPAAPAPEVTAEPQEISDDYYIGMMFAEEAHEEMNAEKVIKYDGGKPIYSGTGVADLKTHYESFKYNFDEATTILTEVYPDRNGNITIYFDGEVSGVNAKVNISKKEDNGRGWGYSVPTDKQQMYHFCNFDPDEVYDVAISSYCPGNYNISGNVLIY